MLAEENKSSGRSPLDGKFTHFAFVIIYKHKSISYLIYDSEFILFDKNLLVTIATVLILMFY